MVGLRRVLHAVACLALICLLVGCGLTRSSVGIDYHCERLNAGLARVRDEKNPAHLRDFTEWSWDEVHLFHEWDERDFIEETVGTPIIKSKIYMSKASLLVFENHGKVVKAAGVEGDYLRGEDGRVTWPADVIVKPFGLGAVELTLSAT